TLLIRRPLLAAGGTAAVLFGGGDVLAQQAFEKRGRNHDYARTARLTFYGGASNQIAFPLAKLFAGVIFSVCMTRWYSFLNSLKFATPRRALAARVALDQLVLTPVAVPFFYGSMSILEGKPHEAIDRIRAVYFSTLVRNWGVFLPMQILNFAIVPPHLRFVFVSAVSLFWNAYLSASNAANARQVRRDAEKELVEVV
ncbi:hypothetical protein C0992_007321, partial [Termitomyces sp. T32_za158]